MTARIHDNLRIDYFDIFGEEPGDLAHYLKYGKLSHAQAEREFPTFQQEVYNNNHLPYADIYSFFDYSIQATNGPRSGISDDLYIGPRSLELLEVRERG